MKKILVVCFTILMFVVGSQSVQAYSLHGWKLPTKTTSFQWGSRLASSGSVLRNGWESAITSWYNSSSVNFFHHSSSVNILNSWNESSSTYYGRMTTWKNNNNVVTQFLGELNAGNTNITKTNVAKSVAVHEFGHTLGIDHVSVTAIMNSNRDRTVTHNPQTDDKNGINAIYK